MLQFQLWPKSKGVASFYCQLAQRERALLKETVVSRFLLLCGWLTIFVVTAVFGAVTRRMRHAAVRRIYRLLRAGQRGEGRRSPVRYKGLLIPIDAGVYSAVRRLVRRGVLVRSACEGGAGRKHGPIAFIRLRPGHVFPADLLEYLRKSEIHEHSLLFCQSGMELRAKSPEGNEAFRRLVAIWGTGLTA